MNAVEKLCLGIRHSRYLGQASGLWGSIRPLYDRVVAIAGKRGLERVINGTDPVLLLPKFRCVVERYEPEVWRSLVSEIRPGDIFADVGVFIGLYTVAVAKRVGPAGRVVGFEPDPANFFTAGEHVKLNGLEQNVELIQAAVGPYEGQVPFQFGGDTAHVATLTGSDTCTVQCVTLDRIFDGRRLDVLKIDVEGFEEKVLRGGSGLLNDKARRPRAIFIEVHPYAWPEIGTTSDSLLELLDGCGYEVRFTDGEAVRSVERYGEIVARIENPSINQPGRKKNADVREDRSFGPDFNRLR